MKVNNGWRRLGWRHPLWDYVRFYTSLRKNENYHKAWLARLKEGIFEVQPGTNLTVPPEQLKLFLRYLDEREGHYQQAADSYAPRKRLSPFVKS